MNQTLAALFLLFFSFTAWAQAPATKPRTISQEINEWITSSENELVGIAEDMPEDKYNFAPTNGEFRGVRNFGKQVKHVGAALQLLSAGILVCRNQRMRRMNAAQMPPELKRRLSSI